MTVYLKISPLNGVTPYSEPRSNLHLNYVATDNLSHCRQDRTARTIIVVVQAPHRKLGQVSLLLDCQTFTPASQSQLHEFCSHPSIDNLPHCTKDRTATTIGVTVESFWFQAKLSKTQNTAISKQRKTWQRHQRCQLLVTNQLFH